MKVQAIGNKIIAKPVEMKKHTSTSGITIPDSANSKLPIGKVISIGSEVKNVKVGDTVLFAKWEGTEIKIENELHFVFEDKPEHIKAIVEL